MAVRMANGAGEYPLLICTDSKWCRDVFVNGWCETWERNSDRNGHWYTSQGNRVKNQHLLEQIKDALDDYGESGVGVVYWAHVNARSGDCYNEEADQLAKDASANY